MTLGWTPGAELPNAGAGGPAFARWLQDGWATTGVVAAISAPVSPASSPLFGSPDGEAWRLEATATGGSDQAACLADLRAGRASVVVTGQQPGFLGGPVLTLLKVATALALARLRTEQGRPTAAVFWCADDDDDLVEALSPVGWDQETGPVRADAWAEARAGRLPRAMIGPSAARNWCGPGATLLAAAAAARPQDPLVSDLARLWTRALAEDWDWARLNVAAVRRVFAGQPLVVVRGNDPHLHAAAGSFYAHLDSARARCVERARQRGRELAAAGHAVPVAERSLARHLYTEAGDRRRALGPADALPSAASLRPGVLLRSAVQDWLLQPIAVVVGPGEAAYLEQLEPVHAELGLTRAPLVPRLFGWLLRADDDPAPLVAGPRATGLDATGASALAAAAAAVAGRDLEDRLVRELGVAPARAARLARGRARRWERGVAAMVVAEARERRRQEQEAIPGWLLPDGQRQERRLAAMAAVGALGDGLPAALLAAARAHLEAGAGGRWHEYLIG
ncbi:MAG: bacillithiol biosynthesis BshC [bacterium]|nr:bacillithiol biosynthesis BshC [bacterium]